MFKRLTATMLALVLVVLAAPFSLAAPPSHNYITYDPNDGRYFNLFPFLVSAAPSTLDGDRVMIFRDNAGGNLTFNVKRDASNQYTGHYFTLSNIPFNFHSYFDPNFSYRLYWSGLHSGIGSQDSIISGSSDGITFKRINDFNHNKNQYYMDIDLNNLDFFLDNSLSFLRWEFIYTSPVTFDPFSMNTGFPIKWLMLYRLSEYVTSTVNGAGKVLPSDFLEVPLNSDCTLEFVPDSGSVVSDVLINGVSVGAVDSYTFTSVNNSQSVEVFFFTPPSFSVTPSVGSGGIITPSDVQSVPEGESVTFSITPKPGYNIEDVLVDGVSVGPVESYTFYNVTADSEIRAVFKYDGTVFEDGTNTFKPEVFFTFVENIQDFIKTVLPVLFAVLLPFLLLYILRRLLRLFKVA